MIRYLLQNFIKVTKNKNSNTFPKEFLLKNTVISLIIKELVSFTYLLYHKARL